MRIFRLLVEAAFVVVAIIALSNLVHRLSESLVRSLYLPGNEIILQLRAAGYEDDAMLEQNSINSREVVIAESYAELVGFAPANAQVDLNVNGSGSRFPIHVSERARFDAWLNLRSGENRIVASVRDGSGDPDAYYASTYWNVVYRPPYQRTPRLLTERLTGERLSVRAPWRYQQFIWGLGEPNSRIVACFEAAGTARETQIETNAVGAFWIRHESDRQYETAVFTPLAIPPADSPLDSDPGIPQTVEAVQVEEPAEGAPSACDRTGPGATVVRAGEIAAGSEFQRALEIEETRSGHYSVKASVKLPQDSALYEWTRPRGWSNRDLITAEEFMYAVFGAAGFLNVVDYESRVSREDDYADGQLPATVTIAFRADINELTLQDESTALPGFMSLAGDALSITPLEETGFDASAMPDELVAGAGLWNGPRDDARGMWLRLGAVADSGEQESEPSEPFSAVDRATSQTSPVAAINQLYAWLPSFVRDLGVWALLAIPFFWFGRVLNDNRDAVSEPFLGRTRAFISTVLLLHFAYILIWFTRIDLYGIIVPRTPEWLQLEGLRLIAEPAPQLVLGASVCTASLALALEKPATAGSRAWPWLRWLVLAPLALLVIAGVSVFDPWLEDPSGAPLWFSIGLQLFALLLVFLFAHWLLRTVLRRPLPLRVALLAALGIVVVPGIPIYVEAFSSWLQSRALDWNISPFVIPGGLGDLAWLVILTLLGAWLLWFLLRLVLGLGAIALPEGWKKHAIIALFVLTALPFDLVRGDDVTVWTYEIFFQHLIYALRFTIIVPVYYFLRQIAPADDFELQRPEIALVAMLFAFYLCGGSTHLLLVPIPLLLGWHLFRERLLDRRHAAQPAPTSIAHRADIIDKLLRLKDMQRLSSGFRKQGEKAYVGADITRQEYEQGLEDAALRVAGAEQDLGVTEREAQETIFAHGPGDGCWSNARSAVLYSIPIIVLFQLGLVNEIFSNEYARSYPLFDIVSPLLGSTISWLISAFVFGYVFHAIRGRNGIEKALAYTVALLLPALVIVLLNGQPLFGESAGKRLLRIALFAFYLGLVAFDLKTLQRHQRGIKDLVAVYGLGPMLAFASSLIALGSVSIGPVITTIVSWLLGLPVGGGE